MEEPALLAAVDRIVGGIEIEGDLCRRFAVSIEEQVDEQPLNRCGVVADLVVARRPGRRRMLEPVQRALAGQRRAVGSPGFELAGQDRHRRVVAQLVVVHQVLVAQGNAEHPLADHGGDLVLNPVRRTAVLEAGGEPPDQPDRLVGGAEEQRAGIRGHRTAVERRHHATSRDTFKLELPRATLCRHRGTTSGWC